MSTQRIAALEGRITNEMRHVAAEENLSPDQVCASLACGESAIPANPAHKSLKPKGIGKPFSVKVNANIGTSLACNDPELVTTLNWSLPSSRLPLTPARMPLWTFPPAWVLEI
jgi:thiamine biosynthesis protein ThiC